MSLIKKHEVTEKQLAANRENRKLCNAPVTDERRERIRAALLCFGFNAQVEEVASHADALLMRRTQDANMREVRRLINLLLKIKRYERRMEALEKTASLHYVSETSGVSSLTPECPEPLSHSNENS